MNKYSPLLFVIIFSFLFGDANVQIRLQNGQIVQGEFVGTYMNHVHILVEEKIIYYACDDITSITYADGGLSYGKGYDYDCSINTVTADILFPPELDPMTGEMTQMLPDVFNPDILKPAVEKATSVIQNPAAEDFVIINGIKFPKRRECSICGKPMPVGTKKISHRSCELKYARELIKDQNDTDEIDIWNKKIPPSVYLEKLSKDSERPYRFMSCGMMFFLFGAGSGIHFGRVDSVETETQFEDLDNIFFSVVGTLCYAAGLYYTSRILRIGPKGLKWIPKTDEGKQFENIKNIQDKNEKEKLAYESLVALAQKSRIRNIYEYYLTEKALDDYLNQIPIVSAFVETFKWEKILKRFKGVSTIP